MSHPAITDDQVRAFDEDGIATLDTPLTPAQIAAAGAAMDRLLPYDGVHPRVSRTCDVTDPEIVEIIAHPFFEAVACRVLRASAVRFFQMAIVNAYPEPGAEFSFWQHVDLQYRLSDHEAVPRKILCSFFLWLSDVDTRRAPMMVRPGSHLLLARHAPGDSGRGPDDPPRVGPLWLKDLPDLPFAEPVPICARAGQVSVLTTATVHGASTNVSDSLRRNLVFTFTADTETIGLSPEGWEQKRRYDDALRACLPPERRHLVGG